MSVVRGVGISGVNYELGNVVRFDELPDRDSVVKRMKISKDPSVIGLECFREMRINIFDAMATCIKGTLADAAVTPEAVDALILCSATDVQAIGTDRHDLGYLLAQTGLCNAFHFGVAQATCVTMHAGLEVAATLVSSDRFQNIVLVTGDAYSNRVVTYLKQNSRFSPAYVCSDGVASCLVSKNAGAHYALEEISLFSNPCLLDTRTAREAGLVAYLDLVRQATTQALRRSDLKRSAIRQAFVGNYFYETVQSVGRAMGIDSDRVYQDNIPRVAHCYSADSLINLKDFCDSEGREPGDCFVLAGTGIGQVGMAVLRVT